MKEKLQQLPAVNDILQEDLVKEWEDLYDYDVIKKAIQLAINNTRKNLLKGKDVPVESAAIIEQASANLASIYQSSLRPTINGTGTVLHTNLGRSLLADHAVDEMIKVANQYSNLEYSLSQGERGSRYEHIRDIVIELTGAEDALMVNNNAAAVLLMLTALTKGREVLISRGELVEIGGAFRIPDVIASCGAYLHEVGATNKTHLRDYEAGINEDTAALLRVHTSNYRLVGFTDSVSDEDFVRLAHANNLPAFNDLGSGLLLDLQEFGLPYEPTVKEMIAAGYDLVTFSGDKLLGGTQAGIIAGKKKYIDILKKHPLLRALRSDKVTIAALEGTLRLYLNRSDALRSIPTLRMICTPIEELKKRAEHFVDQLHQATDRYQAKVAPGHSQIGGGSFPGVQIPSQLVCLTAKDLSGTQLERRLRLHAHHIIARLHDGVVAFDVRTLTEDDIETIVETLVDL